MSRSIQDTPYLGEVVSNWKAPRAPLGEALSGKRVELVALDPMEHAEGLLHAYQGHDQVWDFLPYGPFGSVEDMRAWIGEVIALPAHQFYAIKNLETNAWQGVASYLRIAPQSGSIEVGHINFSPSLQGTSSATEVMYLMMRWAFEAGYRRYEWKCNALNIASRRAAQRLGFSFEGVFRQATISKGRNRDTAWFAIIDSEWPDLKCAFETWLDPGNFEHGTQRQRLGELTSPIRVASDPIL